MMPYLSDDLYSRCAAKLPSSFLSIDSLLQAEYPTCTGELGEFRDVNLEAIFERVLKVVFAIRNVLAQANKKSDLQGKLSDYLHNFLQFFRIV